MPTSSSVYENDDSVDLPTRKVSAAAGDASKIAKIGTMIGTRRQIGTRRGMASASGCNVRP